MHLLTTDLNMQHDGLLYHSPYPYNGLTIPVHTITPRRRPLYCSVRYTKWVGGLAPLDLGVLLDCGLGDVRDSKHYIELRRTVAVACAQAVLDPEYKGEDGPVRLTTSNNFRRTHWLATSPVVEAAGIQDLYDQLSKS
jgi:hypothetical protein